MAALAGFGGYLVIVGQIGIAELAACMLLNGRTIQPILKILSLWVQIESVRSARQKLREINALPLAKPPTINVEMKGRIVFDNVGLCVGENRRSLFEGLSFVVEPGTCLALNGGDGSGKSSLLRLILGEQSATTGTITIDGFAPTELVSCRGNGQIGYVDRDPPVFAGTLLDNLSMFGDARARDAAVEAAFSIGLVEEINRLPHGFDTQVNATSAEFAANGMVQRVAIARALSRKPKILLFNEANTALDYASDVQLLDVLRKLKGTTTLILVSRRPSFLKLADQTASTSSSLFHSTTLADWDSDALSDQKEARTLKVSA